MVEGFKFDQLYIAEVVDNMDPLLQGRIQINVPSVMGGWQPQLLPWARPFNNIFGGDFVPSNPTNTDDTQATTPQKGYFFGESIIPEKNTTVWVWFEKGKYFKNAFYLTGVQLSGTNPHTTFNTQVKPILPELLSAYPDVKNITLKNGLQIFASSSNDTPEIGVFYDGQMFFYLQANSLANSHAFKLKIAGTTIEINDMVGVPSIEIKSGVENSTEKTLLGETTKDTLSDILDKLIAHTHTATGPAAPTTPPNNAADFTAIKGTLATLLSQHFKHN